MDESSRMTIEKKKSKVNPTTLDSKYLFQLQCHCISLDISAEHLVKHRGDTVRLMISPVRFSGDCCTMVIVSNYSSKASIAPTILQHFVEKQVKSDFCFPS